MIDQFSQDLKAFDNEVFKPIKGYLHRYFISNYGRVKSQVREHRILKKTISLGRYKIVLTNGHGEKKNKDVARLVFETFRYKVPIGKVIKHKDGNKANNEISNLTTVNKNEFKKKTLSVTL